MPQGNTVYNLDADALAQISGSGVSVPYAPTYAASITLDVGVTSYANVVTTAAIGNASILASSGGLPGQRLSVIISNDSGGARTITFSTNFRATGTVVGTASKVIAVNFVSDGSKFIEQGRSASAIT
jgi:hypothetical protein